MDTFGAILSRWGKDAAGFSEMELAWGMLTWATFDSSWVHMMDEEKFSKVLERVRQMAPQHDLLLPSS